MEREKKNVQAKMKNESMESKQYNAVKVQKEDMGLKSISIRGAVGATILDGSYRYIEIEDNNRGDDVNVDLCGKIGLDGISVGIHTNKTKVSTIRVIIQK